MKQVEGWKAVWLSTIDNDDDLDDYTDDIWNAAGEREMSPFAKEFGIEWYDQDAREFDIDKNAKTFSELFNGVSHEKEYILHLLRDLEACDPRIYKAFLILNDYQYNGDRSSSNSIFIGNYKYM